MARSLVSIDDISLDEIEGLFALADEFLPSVGPRDRRPQPIEIARGLILATLFYEPSTRTRFSFESAMLRLGGQVLSSASPAASSAAKGESIADTVRVVERYADAIVIRHPREGAARVAADTVGIPVVNGGDGGHEHPTQTLCDLYTLRHAKKTLRGLNVQVRGDLRYGRTVHSLVTALARFGSTVVTAPAPGLELPDHVARRLEHEHGGRPIPDHDHDGIVDAIYMTRLQRERLRETNADVDYAPLDAGQLDDPRYRDAVVLHPLPRVGEIDPALDDDPRAIYFDQAGYGVPVRMALLVALLRLRPGVLDDHRVEPDVLRAEGQRCSNPACITASPPEQSSAPPSFRTLGGDLRCSYCDHLCGQGTDQVAV